MLLLLLLLAVVGQVEAIGALLPIVQLHAPALLANEVTHCSAVVLISLQAVVTHAKHFASEGLGHDSLPALSSGLRQDSAGPHIGIDWLAHSVRCIRLLHGVIAA